MAGHRLRLLGEATLGVEGRSPVRLERKVAGVLAYLALEGPTPRSRLAGLLWPDTAERTARNNLAQALRRLRQAAGGYEAAGGGEVLKLVEGLEADAAQLVLFSFQGRYAEALGLEGELLRGHDYDDCPDFADWLLAEREHLLGLWREALAQEAERLEVKGELRGALALAERLFQADPVSEAGCRRVMRLCYLLGDRGAALSAYHRLEVALHRETGLKPLPETQALAQEIAAGVRVSLPPAQAWPEVPLALLHPPVLVGREREWALLEEAWEAGKVVFIAGEAGVGKSRLLRDFVAHKGTYAWFSARPGDEGTPFAFQARAWREALGRYPDLALPPWARQELARILPDLFPEAPPPWQDVGDKLRLFEAMAELVRGLGKHVEGLVVDDLQHTDPASLEAGAYLASRFVPAPPGVPRSLNAYRRGELSPEAEAGVERLVEAGLAVRVELEPLAPAGVEALLASLGLPGLKPARLAPQLWRRTGGNPFFILETLRAFWEAGGAPEGRLYFLMPKRVKGLIARRLQGLSAAALRLAQAAAMAGDDLTLELAAGILRRRPLDLAGPWAELEAAQILRQGRFAHDLLLETVREGIPAPIQAHLHRQIALSLEQTGAHPARIAQHWLLAGREEAAARCWLVAGRDYQARALHAEALAMLEKALAYGREEATRAEARLLMADIYREQRRYREAEALLETLFESPTPLRVRVEALRTRAYLAIGDHPRAVEYAHEAYLLARELGDEELTHLTLTAYAAALWGVGRAAEAARLLEPELARDHPDPRRRIRVFAYLGALHAHRGCFAEAYPLLEEAYRLALEQDPYWRVLVAAFLVGADVERGEPLAHRELAQAARALGPFDVSEYLALVLARAYLEARDPQAALELLEEGPGERLGPAYAVLGLAYTSQALLALGREEAARRALAGALSLAESLEGAPRALAQVAVAASRLGEAAAQALLARIPPEALGPADRRSLLEAALAWDSQEEPS
ncbi:putative PEP-CTERM system TPR-repeat lipoprotein [Calidithermus terrae]|uniref:Putative PEP-CTERM system TPR-repeat lipoprotein n=1 Tax=Calidithermus terrae TaxID=1408545 RepID=A0A399F1R7_9DEIN|nr:AAA family ATPase [Calidithermus terrae]RIH88521.1 putative PEP-CTERM system TPR-repeat lipoprotein [Calidithermus terrae]